MLNYKFNLSEQTTPFGYFRVNLQPATPPTGSIKIEVTGITNTGLTETASSSKFVSFTWSSNVKPPSPISNPVPEKDYPANLNKTNNLAILNFQDLPTDFKNIVSGKNGVIGYILKITLS